MGEYTRLLFDRSGGLARITLNRPEAANAIDLEMARELADVARRSAEDPAVRCVLLSGSGKIFCAGGDLRSFVTRAPAELREYLRDLTGYLHSAVSHLAQMRAPVIASINGSVGGAGMGLALTADLVLAAESARFVMAYTRAGLTPDGGTSYLLPRLVGVRRAIELTLTNRVLSAAEACQLGLVTRVVKDDELSSAAQALARELAAGPTGAFAAAKRLMHAGVSHALEAQMELERATIADISQTNDGREGVKAFLEKRPPRFTGE